jgi:hypothetical protein
VKVRLSTSDSEYEIDDCLWVEINDTCGTARHYLVGNPHTHPGRMEVYCPSMERFTRISKSEIMSCSRESEYWILGYLHGSCPDLPTDGEGSWLPEDHPSMVEWRASREEFPQTGYWSSDPQRCEYCRRRVTRTTIDRVCPACKGVDEGAGEQRGRNLDKLMVERIGGSFTVSRQEGRSKPYIMVSERIPDLDEALRIADETKAWNVEVTYCGPSGLHHACAGPDSRGGGIKWWGLTSLWQHATEEDEAWVRSQE